MQNQKGISSLVGVVILIIVAVVVIGGGILAYQYWWLPEKIVTPTPTPTPDETAGWKTYRNEEYGFEIKYPVAFNSNELTLTFGKHVPPHGTDLLINGKVSVSDGTIVPLSLSFNVFPTIIDDLEKYVKDKIASGTAFHEKWNKEHPSDPIGFNFTYSKITMGNAIGYAGRYKFLDSGQDNIEIFTQNSKNLIRTSYDPSNNDRVKVIQKILSTFKFTK